MPITSCQQYIKGLLDGLPMPGGAPPLAAYVTPPDPNVESEIPTAYIWPSDGDESRNTNMAGTMPRNTGPGTFSGDKTINHRLTVWFVWFQADDDSDADTLFPGMVDAIMYALRFAVPDPEEYLTDPWTGGLSQLADTGENMRYRIDPPHSTKSQRYLMYVAEIDLPLIEVISA